MESQGNFFSKDMRVILAILEFRFSNLLAFHSLGNNAIRLSRARAARLEIGRNGTDGAGGDALFADNTARSRESKLKRLFIESQGFRGADARTQAAVDAAILVDGNFAAGERNRDILRSHPLDRRFQLVNIAQQFHHQRADLIRGNLGADDIRRHIKIFGQPIGDGHLHRASGKDERYSFFHGS